MSTLKVMIARWLTWLVDRLAFRHPQRTSSTRVRDVHVRDGQSMRRDVQTSHASEKDELARFEGEGGTGNAPPPTPFRNA